MGKIPGNPGANGETGLAAARRLADHARTVTRTLPAAALLLTLLCAGRAEGALVLPGDEPTHDFATASPAADASEVPSHPDEDGPAPAVRPADGGSMTGPSTGVPATGSGAAATTSPPAITGGTLPSRPPLPDACLRPHAEPGGLFRPPRGA